MPKLNKEIWRRIAGFERYEISNMGRVGRDGKILKAFPNREGYPRVHLYRDGKRYEFSVHSLVAHAFIGKRPKRKQIDHKNEIRTDARADNLQYLTRLQNIRKSWERRRAKVSEKV